MSLRTRPLSPTHTWRQVAGDERNDTQRGPRRRRGVRRGGRLWLATRARLWCCTETGRGPGPAWAGIKRSQGRGVRVRVVGLSGSG
jgi:hypothetical protein